MPIADGEIVLGVRRWRRRRSAPARTADVLGFDRSELPFPCDLLCVEFRPIGGELRLGGGDLSVEFRQPRRLLRQRRANHRRRVFAVAVHLVAVEAVEVGEQRVEVALRQRVVLVIVAARAADRQAQHHRAEGFDAIDDVA